MWTALFIPLPGKATSKMKHTKIAIFTLLAFMAYYLLITGIVPSPIKYSSHNLSFLLFYILCCIPSYITLQVIHKKNLAEAVGLKRSPIRGISYALLCVLPMLLYVIIFGEWNNNVSLLYLFNATIVAGLFEEFFFRGLLLGQLFRYAKWGFIPAILVASVIFGFGHIYQGTDITSSVMAGVITGLGGLLFGWIYIETKYNLWCSIFLHILMNFSWSSFSITDNGAIGNTGLNIVRFLTVVIAVSLIVIRKKKKDEPYLVNTKTLWVNR